MAWFQWDPSSNLVATSTTADARVYVYDASGQRLAQIKVTDVTASATPLAVSVYVGNVQVDDATLGVAGGVTATRFVVFGSATVATVTVTDGGAPVWSLLLGDVQGSAQVSVPLHVDDAASGGFAAATQADGDGVERAAYTPYGARRGVGELSIDRGWLGQVEDTGTGLTYLNARYYDPTLMRFLSPDPLMDPGDPRTLDAYRYGENNPIAYTDASGLCSTTGSWGYVGGVLEPPCSKSNGKRYEDAAPQTPDVFHGESGWRQSGGNAGRFPTDSPKTMYENIRLKGMVYLPNGGPPVGGGGPNAYECMYGELTNPVGEDHSDVGHVPSPGEQYIVGGAIILLACLLLPEVCLTHAGAGALGAGGFGLEEGAAVAADAFVADALPALSGTVAESFADGVYTTTTLTAGRRSIAWVRGPRHHQEVSLE